MESPPKVYGGYAHYENEMLQKQYTQMKFEYTYLLQGTTSIR